MSIDQHQPLIFFWFRRDLRLEDNTGLHHALQTGLAVQPVFIFDKQILDLLPRYDKRVIFIHRTITEINQQLKQYGAQLMVVYDNPVQAWEKWLAAYNIHSVYYNHDYEPYAIERDVAVQQLLTLKGVHCKHFKDHVLFEQNEVLTSTDAPYTVFTPYKNKWLKIADEQPIHPQSEVSKEPHFYQNSSPVVIPTLEDMGFRDDLSSTFPSHQLQSTVLNQYTNDRNYPGIAGTSRLGIHLRFGTISIRQLAVQAQANHTFLSELIWRDFYAMILYHFPYVATQAFKPAYESIPWRNFEDEFKRWCEGQTGYPIVDAGMRELNETGFMHNRVRMITASFLTKHLLIDWRWGEAYFAEKLLDFDLASNNGGWQWAAGTGCDAAPYFRIFNPTEQTKKFDPQFRYIQQWVPEFSQLNYPKPMVEHSFARQRALETYKKALAEYKPPAIVK